MQGRVVDDRGRGGGEYLRSGSLVPATVTAAISSIATVAAIPAATAIGGSGTRRPVARTARASDVHKPIYQNR